MKIIVTGAGGFIGSALCRRLSSYNKVIGVDHRIGSDNNKDIVWEKTDLTDSEAVSKVIEKHSPDVIIHCAAIAHQKAGAIDYAAYMRVNSEATANLAEMAAKHNPDVKFIFLSSISVYGEEGLSQPVSESSPYNPTSDYAASKVEAEKRLIALNDSGVLKDLIILRLAPVYDSDWTFNIDKRVLLPKKIAYVRFGPGEQQISALARPNLVDFIGHILNIPSDCLKLNLRIINVCDSQPYTFNQIIEIFKKSHRCPKRLVVFIPLFFVFVLTRIGGLLMPSKKSWIHSCYDKLASSLVFDNKAMLETGFVPPYSLETVLTSKVGSV